MQATVISILLLLFKLEMDIDLIGSTKGDLPIYHHGFSQYCCKILEESTLFLIGSAADPTEALTLIIINVHFNYICIKQSNFSNACSSSVLLWQL